MKHPMSCLRYVMELKLFTHTHVYDETKYKPKIVELVKLLAVGRAHFENVLQCRRLNGDVLIVHVDIIQLRFCLKYSLRRTCDRM